jgi:hypothetical protein
MIIKNPIGEDVNDFEYYLGSRLAMPELDRLTLEMEYFHVNKKYKISVIKEERPICVVAWGYNLVAKSKYRALLHSI